MPKNSFPTYPNEPSGLDKIKIYFTKEKNKSFVEELKFTFDNVFSSSGSFSMQRVYNTQTAFGDDGGAHFRGAELYPNPYYVGFPDSEFYARECFITYWKDEVPSKFIGKYDDWGPDGIFFWFEGTADGIKKWYSDFDKLEWGPLENEQNSLGDGTVSLSELATYRSIGPSIYNFSFDLTRFGLGADAPNGPVRLFEISPSDSENSKNDSVCYTHKTSYNTFIGNYYEVYLAYGVPFHQTIDGFPEDLPPQWFIEERSVVDGFVTDIFRYYLNNKVFGNGDPDNFKIDGPFSDPDIPNLGWNVSYIA